MARKLTFGQLLEQLGFKNHVTMERHKTYSAATQLCHTSVEKAYEHKEKHLVVTLQEEPGGRVGTILRIYWDVPEDKVGWHPERWYVVAYNHWTDYRTDVFLRNMFLKLSCDMYDERKDLVDTFSELSCQLEDMLEENDR